MPGLPEDTASLARKVYHRVQVLRSIQTATEMSNFALGGAKGEPGKYLERHSRGRGRN